MADYDSDSSLEDAQDGTETNVILGFATGKPSEGAVSHLGGHPVWFDPSYSPPAALSKCRVCNDYMSLLLQLNGDLPTYFPNDERRLYIFICRRKTCARKIGSVRAFREVKKYKSQAKQLQTSKEIEQEPEGGDLPQDLGAVLFGAAPTAASTNANPFSASGTSDGAVNPFASLGPASSLAAKPPQRTKDSLEPPSESFAQKLRISSSQNASQNEKPQSEPWPPESAFPTPFSVHDLESDFELLYPDSPSPPEAGSSKAQYDTEDSNAGAEKDLYESDVDKAFLKFSDRLSHNPEQVLRYEFNGTPLLYGGNDAVAWRFVVPHGRAGSIQGLPRCETCGVKRVFECQLVPGAISILEEGEDILDLESGMEWGTIILGVCSEDCGVVEEVVFREEWVGVQWEERVAKK